MGQENRLGGQKAKGRFISGLFEGDLVLASIVCTDDGLAIGRRGTTSLLVSFSHSDFGGFGRTNGIASRT